MNPESFWKLDLGNVLTLVIILLTLVKMHTSNKSDIKKGIVEYNDLKNKAENMYDWFCENKDISGKVNLMYKWFENNLVGRGEPDRTQLRPHNHKTKVDKAEE